MNHTYRLSKSIFSVLLISFVIGMGGLSMAAVPISGEAIGFAEITLNKKDPGISWMYNQWLKAPRPNSLKALAINYPLEKAFVGVYPATRQQAFPFCVISQTRENLTSQEVQMAINKIMLSEIGQPKFNSTLYKTVPIYYGKRADNQGEVAYFINGNRLVWGTDLNLVKKTFDVTKGAGSIDALPDYMDLLSKTPPGNEVILFMNNSQNQMANALITQERKWKMSMLLSAKDISGIILSLNFVDGDKITGRMVFKAKNPAKIADIKDDANFLGEAIRRKFSFTKIGYSRKIQVSGNYVTLDFEMNGMKPLFQQLFLEGVSSLLR